MPAKKTNKVTQVPKKASIAANGFLSQIKWGESYTSLFLGAVVVIVALILVVSFIKSRNIQKQQSITNTTTSQVQLHPGTNLPTSYTVKQGDDLWSIAQKLYGSGYNWVDLASANKLVNPGLLYVDTKLTIPNVKPKLLTVSENQQTQIQNPITSVSYTVVKGDFLWNIAVRAYGDGYRWIDIAKANNLANPDIIHVGNILKLPR
jgi:putative chitinase